MTEHDGSGEIKPDTFHPGQHVLIDGNRPGVVVGSFTSDDEYAVYVDREGCFRVHWTRLKAAT